jgi:hypothetical protein
MTPTSVPDPRRRGVHEPIEVDREPEGPSESEGPRSGMVRRPHHPGLIWLGMAMMVTLAYVLGALN